MLLANPQVHGIGDDEACSRCLLQHAHLRDGRAVREKDELALPERFGERRPKIAEDVKMNLQRLAVVHIGEILALPKECLAAANNVQTGRVNPSAAQQLHVLRRKILANYADELDWSEEAGGIGKI